MIPTEKGGIGKSTLLSLLAGWITKDHPDLRMKIFDPDGKSGSLALRVPGVAKLDMRQSHGGDTLMEALHDADVVLVDGVGNVNQSVFMPYLESIDIWSILDELNLDLTFLLVVEDQPELIAEAGRLYRQLAGRKTDIVIFRSQRLALSNEAEAPMPLWEESAVRRHWLEAGALELVMPKIGDSDRESVWSGLETNYYAAAKESTHAWVRGRILRMLGLFEAQFRKGAQVLLPTPTVTASPAEKETPEGAKTTLVQIPKPKRPRG